MIVGIEDDEGPAKRDIVGLWWLWLWCNVALVVELI